MRLVQRLRQPHEVEQHARPRRQHRAVGAVGRAEIGEEPVGLHAKQRGQGGQPPGGQAVAPGFVFARLLGGDAERGRDLGEREAALHARLPQASPGMAVGGAGGLLGRHGGLARWRNAPPGWPLQWPRTLMATSCMEGVPRPGGTVRGGGPSTEGPAEASIRHGPGGGFKKTAGRPALRLRPGRAAAQTNQVPVACQLA
jgi:hypothetical protein